MSDPTVSSVTSSWLLTSYAALLAAVGFVIRWLIGRHSKSMDSVENKFDIVMARLDKIESDVAFVKGRFSERDRSSGRHSTWPGESR
jgi:hypothetical protein